MQTLQTHLARQPIDLRARLLLALEKFFPVLEAPRASGEHARYEFAKAAGSYAPLVERLGGLEGKHVLDFGCGWGGETVWLAQRAATAVGCDISRAALEDASRFAAQVGGTNVRFVHIEGGELPFDDGSFDAVLSTNVFEHVMDVDAALRQIARVLRPGGSFLSTFGPLFYSPLGYHLPWATQVPFAHLLFGFKSVMEVRNLKREPIIPAPRCWEDTGLNRLTFARFRAAALSAGFELRRLKKIPVRGLRLAAALPGIGDLFTFGVDCQLVKPTRGQGR